MKRLVITIVLLLIIYYFYYKENQVDVNYKKLLKPKISNEMSKKEYNDITEILFKIQLFYYHNPETFTEIIKNLDIFVILIKSVRLDNSLAGIYYDLLLDRKSLILNSLRSFIINIPGQFNYKDAINDLEKVLNKYLDEVYLLNKKNIYEQGIDRDTKIIDRYNLAHNRFTDNIASFGFY